MRAFWFLGPAWVSAVLSLPSVAAAGPAPADTRQTVCTITINSSDEKEALRRRLPESRFRFVELVQPGKRDWLNEACRTPVRCDVLVLSGHYDGRSVFYSDRPEDRRYREFLPVADLERQSCSASCPTLFSQLKEVYLFGCNTLNPAPQSRTTAEIQRSLLRSGARSSSDAQRRTRAMSTGLDGGSRDRMREVFAGVPVIYGFRSLAPVGEVAGPVLERYLKDGGSREVGRGVVSRRLLSRFSAHGLASAPGLTGRDPLTEARREICTFADDRVAPATKLDFAHGVVQQDLPRTLLHLDRIRRLMAGLDDAARRTPAVAQALKAIAADAPAKDRFLAQARRVEQADLRVDLIDLGHELGWLTPVERRHERVDLVGALQARPSLSLSDVDLVCDLNEEHELDGMYAPSLAAKGGSEEVAHSAVRACLGSADHRARTLAALTSPRPEDVLVAHAYLRYRPIQDAAELRRVATNVAAMPASAAQVNALDVLARHYVADRGVVDQMVRLYAKTSSSAVQEAVAGVLIRADRRQFDAAQMRTTLQARRLPSGGGGGMVDALIRQLSPS